MLSFGIFSNYLFAKNPMSAIDWLAEKINDPPNFLTNPAEKLGKINNNIEKHYLPNISKNSIGVFSSIRLGLAGDIWKYEKETEISHAIEKIKITDLYYFNRFFKRVLLIEADPPIMHENHKFSGAFFIRARISKLIKMGALDDAEALLLSANPNKDPNLMDLWAELSFLTSRLDNFCEAVLNGYSLNSYPAHKIICLARNGDWNASALALATYSSINEIDVNLEKLLINYLDNEAELEINDKNFCFKNSPLIVYLCNFSNKNFMKRTLGVKYLYPDLSRGKSLRSRLMASEELVKSGALNPNFLFSSYKIKEPSTSGGVWARAKLIQDFEKKLKSKVVDSDKLFEQLNFCVNEFLNQDLLTQFAEYYGDRLKEIKSNHRQLNELTLALIMMSGKDISNFKNLEINNSKLQNVLNVVEHRDNFLLKTKLKNNHFEIFHNNDRYEQLTSLQKIILEASNGVLPKGRNSSENMLNALSENRNGFVLLHSLFLISTNTNSDILDLQAGLASLVKLGLIDAFKSISNELLIMEYFRRF